MRRHVTLTVLVLALVSARAGWAEQGEAQMALSITSSAFRDGGTLGRVYTCDGKDISPPLAWQNVPAGTKSLALICDDPDAPAGTWVHWVLYNVPANATRLPEGVPTTATLQDGSRQGRNDFGRVGYGGPCPPRGKPHRYSFTLYALDIMLELAPRASKADVEKAMKGHVLAQAQMHGTYGRS